MPSRADIRVDDRLAAVVLELAAEIDDFVTGQLAPAVCCDLAVLRVQPNDDMTRERGARILQEARIFSTRPCDDHVLQTVVEIPLDGVQVANAAAELHRMSLPTSWMIARMASSFFGLAGKCAVQVDEMQPPCAPIDP